MLPHQRRDTLLKEVQASGAVRVVDVADALGVSEMTIRRDLEELDRLGLVRRVHGGATSLGPGASDEPGFAAKATRELAAKQAIAQAARELVRPGMTIAISAGTTTYAFAATVTDVEDLTVVTNSTDTADLLFDALPRSSQVVVTGGVRTRSHALVGPVAISALRSLHVDLVFHGFHGFDPKAGFTCPNLAEVATAQAMIDCGRSLVVLVDHTKAGVVALAGVVPLSRADVVVTDSLLADQDRAALSEHVPDVVVVPVGPR